MPKATASWLIENTSLSFKQISNFVGLHILEIQAIADGEVSNGILSRNPLENGELTDESVLMSGYRIQIGKFNLIITKVDKK